MISILIVDDSSSKIAEIKEVLFEYPLTKNLIEVVVDTNNARRLIETNKYDLLILDLVLPNEFGDIPDPNNGIEFLNEICTDPNKNQPYHIIGLSGHPEHIECYSLSFKKHLWYLIEYKEEIEDWKEILRNKIEYLINSKTMLNKQKELLYDFDVAIITALQKELDKILKLDCNWSPKTILNDSTTYYFGSFKREGNLQRIVATSAPQMGTCAASTLSMKIISNFKPKYLLMSGIAAGIKGEVKLGDILIPEQIWDGASGKIKNEKETGNLFQPDPRYKILDEDIKDKLLTIKQTRKYLDEIRNEYPGVAPETILDVHIGPMASVPAVIQSNDEIKKIQSISRKLIGIEMESYGVFYSAGHCQNPKPKVISIKSVSDFANEEKNDSLQDYASYTSASFIYKIITNDLEY